MKEEIVIAAGFRGRPDSANGGYASGVLADHVTGAVEVTLRRPVPLERPLTLARNDTGVLRLCDGGSEIATAEAKPLDLDVPDAPAREAVAAASANGGSSGENVFAGCFVCGWERHVGEGLRVFAGSLPGTDLVAALWRPHAAFADAAGDQVAARYLWGALDCPSALALGADIGMNLVTGRMHGVVTGAIPVEEDCMVIAWPIGQERRKYYSAAAIIAPDGTVAAKAFNTWIAVRD
jgi:hypothetical protein